MSPPDINVVPTSLSASYEVKAEIFNGKRSVVYRGHRSEDDLPVILKTISASTLDGERTANFKREYDVLSRLDIEGVIQVFKLKESNNNLIMVMEDIGGSSLDRIITNEPPALETFLSIAIAIAEIVGNIHHQHLIHKNLNPSHIIWEPIKEKVQIIGFSGATELPFEKVLFQNPANMQVSLDYISPEQTGRMNRIVDYRTDLYSLGIIFYELLTGETPFSESDPLELVHCHIAQQAQPPHRLNRDIPKQLSNIIMCLMEKNAEDRYQSAFALMADLKECQSQWNQSNKIKEFNLGKKDFLGKLDITQKLYGRTIEVQKLLDAFDRVKNGDKELFLIGGYTGVGKTALAHETHKPITARKGYFIEGKFDQYQRNIPYSAWIQAFTGMVDFFLTEREAQLAGWKEKILRAVGDNGKVLTDVIPNLELILGAQPSTPEIGSTEAQNRFNYVFQKFINVVSQKEHPLVVFLDDLQWADSASLSLVRTLMTDTGSNHLLLIGAYRDNEVDASHPLMIEIESLASNSVQVEQLTLGNLLQEHVDEIVSDAMHSAQLASMALAQLIFSKTYGNAFFVHQMLHMLDSEDFLNFDYEMQHWQWDMVAIEAMEFSDNVLDLLLVKLNRLPAPTQSTLMFSACIGNRFDLETLALISQQSKKLTLETLEPAIQEHLVLPLDVNYKKWLNSDEDIANTFFKFKHDRIQQAVYGQLISDRKKELHLLMGQRMLEQDSSQSDGVAINLLEMVEHLNIGRSLISEAKDKIELARLNLKSGLIAKESTAYTGARKYLAIAAESLPDNCWSEHYKLTLKVYTEFAEIEYLNGNSEQAESLCAMALGQAKSALDKANIQNILIVQNTMAAKYGKAMRAAQQALILLNAYWDETDLTASIEEEFSIIRRALDKKDINKLHLEEPMREPDKLAAIQILANTLPLTFISDQSLFPMVVAKAVNLSLQLGPAAQSAMSYAAYGIILTAQGDYKEAHQFGAMALKLSQKFNDYSQQCRAGEIWIASINHWVEHIETSESVSNDACAAGMLAGEFQYVGYTRLYQASNLLYSGTPLDTLSKRIGEFLLFSNKTKNLLTTDVLEGIQIAIAYLSGTNSSKPGESILNDNSYRTRCENNQSRLATGTYLILKSQAQYLCGELDEAFQNIQEAENYLPDMPGAISLVEHNFYSSLITLSLYRDAEAVEQAEYLDHIKSKQKQMKTWTENCSENFQNKYFLIEAEIARVSSNESAAINYYDKAIVSARENGFIQNEALANELFANFWLEKGNLNTSRLHLAESIRLYGAWGASNKIDSLRDKYPQFPNEIFGNSSDGNSIEASSDTANSEQFAPLDLESVIRASHVISEEIELEQLIRKIIHVIIENAGARKGVLIFTDDKNPVYEVNLENTDKSSAIKEDRKSGTTTSFPQSIVNYVKRIGKNVVLDDACIDERFQSDPYLGNTKAKSVLCLPVIRQANLLGVLYLENNLASHVFTLDRVKLAEILVTQAAISLDNARIYEDLKHEIDEHEKSRQELQLSEERFRSIFEQAAVGVALVDCNSGDFADVNQRYCDMLGYSLKEMLEEKSVQKITYPEDLQASLENMDLLLTDEVSEFSMEKRLYHKDGSIIWVNLTVSPTWKPGEEAEYSISVVEDITERKQAEQERQQLQQQLFRAQKMDELGQLTGGIAHDFNNILAGMLGYTQLAHIHSLNAGEDQLVQYLDQIQHGGDRATELIKQMLAYSRDDPSEVSLQSIQSLIEDVLRLFQPTVPSNIAIDVQFSAEFSEAVIDPVQFEQMLMNLCVNARDSITRGGRIELMLSNIVLDEEECAACHGVISGTYISLLVKDSGSGMSAETMARIFEPFYSTKEKGKGTGMGLSMTDKIIHNCDGHLLLDSTVSVGTTFNVLIPLTNHDLHEENTSTERKQFRPHNSEQKNRTIMVVDDESFIVDSLGGLLKASGYDVITSTSANDALVTFQQNPEDIDLLVTDQTMPGLTGIDLAREMLALRPDFPIIICTGFSDEIDESSVKKAGIKSYFLKPVDTGILMDKVEELLGSD